jgi:hypothetical protein
VKHLSVELSEVAVRFTTSINDVVNHHAFLFKDKKDHSYKEQLEDFIAECGLKNQDFDEQTISWSTIRSTLVPANIFGESNPVKIYRLCFGDETPKDHIDYNRIPEQGIVNLFEIPLWVKSFFVIKYPRSIIQHEGSHVIRGLFS